MGYWQSYTSKLMYKVYFPIPVWISCINSLLSSFYHKNNTLFIRTRHFLPRLDVLNISFATRLKCSILMTVLKWRLKLSVLNSTIVILKMFYSIRERSFITGGGGDSNKPSSFTKWNFSLISPLPLISPYPSNKKPFFLTKK